MKEGRTLQALAQELDRQKKSKKDFIADTRSLFMDQGGNLNILLQGQAVTTELTSIAHRQIATHTKIPQRYYDACPPELKALNVNHWFHNEPTQRMVRTLDNKTRAFLSNRYRCLDNYELAEAILPVLQEVPSMTLVSCELTDTRMYLKALFPKIKGEIQKGDVVQSGVVISNSEIGYGSLKVEPLVYRLACKNGLISSYAEKKYHVGRTQEAEEQAQELFRDETLQAIDRAFWLKVQDTVRASVDQAKFKLIVKDMQECLDKKITVDPVEVVVRVQQELTMTDHERGSVLRHLIDGKDLSAYGLLNAVTRTSQDLDDYDRATEFERLGGQVITLAKDKKKWEALAQAA